MAHVWADRVAETTTTTGTGALALTGAITGYFRFSSAKRSDGTSIQIGDTLIYGLEAVDGSGAPTGDSEWGVGTYSALNTLTRTTPLGSSNGGSVVTLAAGTKNVWLDDIASTRNTLQEYSGTSEPSAPVSGLISFAQDRNGWKVPYAKGVTNKSGAVDHFWTGRPFVGRILPSPAGSIQGLGMTATSASALTISPSATNAYTRFVRFGLNTTTTASTVGSLREAGGAISNFFGTNTHDGVRVVFRFGLETVGNTNCRWFVGLLASAAATAATFDPNASAQAEIGIGATSTDTTNMQFYHNDAVGAPSKLDLGSNYPAKTAQGGIVEMTLEWGPSASAVNYTVRRLDDLTITPTTGSFSSDLPASGSVLSPHFTINNNATAAQSVLAFAGLAMEIGI